MPNLFDRCRAVAVAAALPLVLTACLSRVLPEAAPPPVTYDFGPLPEERSTPLPVRFRLDSVSAPSWLRTQNIYYRRLYEQPAALTPYARNVWIAPASELFAERLGHRLAQAEPEVSSSELPLALQIVTFEHVYTAPDAAYVVARARASYDGFDDRTRGREFVQRRPAAATVEGATAELPRAAELLVDDMIAWLAAEAPNLDR